MISINNALNTIQSNTEPLATYSQPLAGALGYVLAADVIAPINLPPFAQSAMDGYAVKVNINVNILKYNIVGEIKAGDAVDNLSLLPGEAVRIFTGAAVPLGADAVVMQEKVERNGEQLLLSEPIKPLLNIRPIGEQIRQGEVALKKGSLLNAAGIGFLSSLGLTEVEVHKTPVVSVIVTGSELVEPGKPLNSGQVYESNSLTILAALNASGYTASGLNRVKDNYEDTRKAIADNLTQSDVVIITGGISVGDYDFVGKVLPDIGVEQIFYKVNQKPGKPIYFGKKNNALVFSLPGNPAAALSCFYMYVLPALKNLSGHTNYQLETIELPLADKYQKKGDRAHLLKANITGNSVATLEGQSSAMLHTFALANALIFIPEEVSIVEKGSLVKVFKLPV